MLSNLDKYFGPKSPVENSVHELKTALVNKFYVVWYTEGVALWSGLDLPLLYGGSIATLAQESSQVGRHEPVVWRFGF